MLENAFTTFERQIQAPKLRISLFQLVHNTQRLEVVLKPPVGPQAFIQRVLSGMAEGGVSEVVCQANCLREVLIQAQSPGCGTRYLRDLDGVCDARAVEVAFVIHEDLGFIDQASEGVGMNDPVAIALEFASEFGLRLRVAPAAGLVIVGRVGR